MADLAANFLVSPLPEPWSTLVAVMIMGVLKQAVVCVKYGGWPLVRRGISALLVVVLVAPYILLATR